MTAPLLSDSSSSLLIAPWFGYRASTSIAHTAQRSPGKSVADKSRDRANACASDVVELSHLWSRLLELLPQGVVVVARNLKLVYWNQKARQLCQALSDRNTAEGSLPTAILEACHGVMRDWQSVHSSLMLECSTSTGHLVRVSMRPLELINSNKIPAQSEAAATELFASSNASFIVVFLENCEEILQQEAHIQQQKYDLTDREAEVWMLLRQELTYQEIAQALQISLNTVKTHVKNVYAKRRSSQSHDKFWC